MVFNLYERESSSPHHSSKQVVCDDLLWENIANLQHRFFSPPGLRQHAIDIKEKKKNAICRTGHWDRSKQKVMKRVIQEEGESSRWSKKPFFFRKKNIFLGPPYPLLLLAPHLTPPCWKGSRWSFEESFSIPATLFSLAFSTREFYTHTEQTTTKGLLSRFNFPFC